MYRKRRIIFVFLVTIWSVLAWCCRHIRYFWRVYIKRIPTNIYFALPIGLKVSVNWKQYSPEFDWGDWLRANVGPRYLYWNWRTCYTESNIIEIKILKRKQAIMFQLMV